MSTVKTFPDDIPATLRVWLQQALEQRERLLVPLREIDKKIQSIETALKPFDTVEQSVAVRSPAAPEPENSKNEVHVDMSTSNHVVAAPEPDVAAPEPESQCDVAEAEPASCNGEFEKDLLKDRYVAILGTLTSMSHGALTKLIQQLGGTFVTKMEAPLHYVVVGVNPGKRALGAVVKDAEVMSEADFLAMLRVKPSTDLKRASLLTLKRVRDGKPFKKPLPGKVRHKLWQFAIEQGVLTKNSKSEVHIDRSTSNNLLAEVAEKFAAKESEVSTEQRD